MLSDKSIFLKYTPLCIQGHIIQLYDTHSHNPFSLTKPPFRFTIFLMSKLDNLFGKKKKKEPKKTLSQKNTKAPPKKLTENEKEDIALEKDINNSDQKDKRGLLPRQLKFIHNHLLGINEAKAAADAGYSKKTAAVIASELLRKPAIQKEIKKRVKAVIARADDKISKMIEHLYICSYYKTLDIVDENGKLRYNGDRKKLGDLAFAITGIETKLNAKSVPYTVIKLADKKSSREQLGKYLQMFSDKLEVTGGLTLNIGKPPEAIKPAAESAIDNKNNE